MSLFLFKKILIGFISLIAVILSISLIIYMAPVDPARIQFGQRADPETINQLKKKFYLDQPYYIQVYRYLEDLSCIQYLHNSDPRLEEYSFQTIFQSNNNKLIVKWPFFRRSYVNGELVSDLLKTAMISTGLLGLFAMLFALIIGLISGTLAAVYFGTWIDSVITMTTTFFYAIPSYISAVIIAMLLGYYLVEYTHLPLQGSLYSLDDFGNEVFNWDRLVLPSLALGLRPVAMIAQMTRASLLEIRSKEYIRTAISLGSNTFRVLIKHIYPNAMNPIITTLSGWFASLLSGAFFVEFVFNFRGLGDLTIQALSQFDIPVVLACCIVTVCIFVTINILADVIYAWLDPRVKI